MPVAMEKYGAGNQTGDYADLGKAMGATGIKVEDPRELIPALEKAQRENAEGRVTVIEVITRQDTRFSQYANFLAASSS